MSCFCVKNVRFRRLPRSLTSWLDRPGFINRLTAKNSIKVDAGQLGELTLSMLRGKHGNQRNEVTRCVAWMKEKARPDLVNLSNLLIAGFVPALKRELNVPVLVTLQGDDLFLEELTDQHRPEVLAELRRLALEVDGFITFSESYAQSMAELLEIPREKFHVVTLGIDTHDFSGLKRISGRPPTVGYFGRIAPEKGFARIVDAFIRLHSEHHLGKACLRTAGWLGKHNRDFFKTQVERIEAAGLGQNFNYTGAPDRQGKLEFFSSIDAFSLPTTYREPKGLPVLEALASGIPVVQPEHGIFPEMLSKTGGGILIAPGDSKALAASLATLLENPGKAGQLGEEGRMGVIEKCTGRHMANETLNIYRQFLES